MSRVCLITAYPPARRELGGGGWVDRRLIEMLSGAGHQVELVSVTGPGGRWWYGDLAGESAGGVPLEVRGDKVALARIAVRMLIGPQPYLSGKFTAFPGWSAVVELLRARGVDRQVITSGWPSLLAAQRAGVPVAAHVAHNVESVIADRHAPTVLRLLGERWRLSRAERRLLALPERVFTLSRTDAARLVDLGIDAAPLPIPLSARAKHDPTRRAVGFIGKASWPPNAAALTALLGPVHRELSARGVPAPFVLAGRGTEEFAGHERVITSGWVADEADFYACVGLVVVPRFGVSTGISVKMLEATEFGVAAVVPEELAAAVDPDGPWPTAMTPARTAEVIARWWADPGLGDPTDWLDGRRVATAETLLC